MFPCVMWVRCIFSPVVLSWWQIYIASAWEVSISVPPYPSHHVEVTNCFGLCLFLYKISSFLSCKDEVYVRKWVGKVWHSCQHLSVTYLSMLVPFSSRKWSIWLCLRANRKEPSPWKLPPSWHTHQVYCHWCTHTKVFSFLTVELEMLHWWSSALDDGLRLHGHLGIALSSLGGLNFSVPLRSGLAILSILANDMGRNVSLLDKAHWAT